MCALFAMGAQRAACDTPPDDATKKLKPRSYAPGVRIDWTERRVEVAAKVVLRRGPLELLACSPQTREHESIFVSPARPQSVYQAMGLIGLDPGTPVRFDETAQRWAAPTGSPLRVTVRCGDNSDALPVARLLQSTAGETLPEALPWVFAGSTTDRNKRFAADNEGTLICLVDFESALIALASLHTSDNAQLWLEANTDAIPPIGTECTILIEARDRTDDVIEIRIGKEQRILIGGKQVTKDELSQRLRTGKLQSGPQAVRLVVDADADADTDQIEQIEHLLRATGVEFETVRLTAR